MSVAFTPYPLLLRPVYKDYVWGGRRIARRYRRSGAPPVCAESWEIADRSDGMSVVRNGPWAGRSLRALVAAAGPALVGRAWRGDAFPLLVKILDAREHLSVQVHPDASAARRFGGEPKTELWYVLAAAPGARVYAGLKRGVDALRVRRALQAGAVASLLRAVPVARGDVLFIPGGRPHAIGAGCLLLEIQQNSDTTYRLYDWGRVGRDGRPRALQIAQALRAIRWRETAPLRCAPPAAGSEARLLWQCPWFRVERVTPRGPRTVTLRGDTFHALFVERGTFWIRGGARSVRAPAGTTVLIPAALAAYSVRGPRRGGALVRLSLPSPAAVRARGRRV